MLSKTNSDAIENLIPALFQVFGLIILGYLSACYKLIDASHAKGLSSYVTKFALPAVFFRVMMSIDFSGVSWLFVFAVSLAKLILYLITFILSLILTRCSNFGMAGLLSMFVTQSNDVALAYPIPLYPNLATYVYLFAPAQLAVLNPISYFTLEWQSSGKNPNLHTLSSSEVCISTSKRILIVLLRVCLNPLFFMTVIGVILNFILNHNIPSVFDNFLSAIAQSFAALALFYLGFSMVGKMGQLDSKCIYLIVLLLIAKLVVMPFIMRETVIWLNPIDSFKNSSSTLTDLSTFAFLYGTCPTAPPVFLFAIEYNIFPDAIAAGLVIGTFLCAPIMFIFARITTAYSSDYQNILVSTIQDVSSASILFCAWTFAIFILSKKYQKYPQRFTMFLCISVFTSCLGQLIFYAFSKADDSLPPSWVQYLLFTIFFISCNGARVWTLMITATMYFQVSRGSEFIQRNRFYFYIIALSLPTLATAIILIIDVNVSIELDPIFQHGRLQVMISLIILSLCSMGTIIFLILFVRERQNESFTISNDDVEPLNPHNSIDSIEQEANSSLLVNENNTQMMNSISIDSDLQLNRHLTLIISLLISMFFGICLCTWRLVEEKPSGIYVVLQFLDGIFNFGQGFILFALFGLDSELIISPIKSLLCAFWKNNIGPFLAATSERRRKIFMKFDLNISNIQTGTETSEVPFSPNTSTNKSRYTLERVLDDSYEHVTSKLERNSWVFFRREILKRFDEALQQENTKQR